MNDVTAFWIAPQGEVIPVTITHIDMVVKNLRKFGLDQKEVDALYKQHNEPVGFEGKAREDIMIAVMGKNWMRLRYVPKRDMWTVQVNNFSKKKKEYLFDWANKMIEGKYGVKAGKFTDVSVIDMSGRELFKGNLNDILTKFFEESLDFSNATKYCLIEDYQGDPMLVETSLARVWQHANSNKPITIMTAFRGENTKQENEAKNRELGNLVRDAGFGYFFLDGVFVENQGTDKEVRVKEKSLFIIGDEKDNGKLLGFTKKMIKKYNQDAAIFKKEDSKEMNLLFQDGSMKSVGEFKPNKISSAYSKLKGNRTFVFESAYTRAGFMANLVRYHTQKIKLVLNKIDNFIAKPYNEI